MDRSTGWRGATGARGCVLDLLIVPTEGRDTAHWLVSGALAGTAAIAVVFLFRCLVIFALDWLVSWFSKWLFTKKDIP